MKHAVAQLMVALLAFSGCGLLKPDYDPCPSDGTGAPVPGPVIEPVSVGAGDNGAGERYRKLADGTVCVCGPYEIGCHETIEGAESSMSCGYNAQGQPECVPVVRPPDPPYHWDNESGQNVPSGPPNFRMWTCPYEWIDKKSGEVRYEERTQKALTYDRANVLHHEWCATRNRNKPDWQWNCRDCDYGSER